MIEHFLSLSPTNEKATQQNLETVSPGQQLPKFLEGRLRVLGEHIVITGIKHMIAQCHLELYRETLSDP